MKSAHSIFGLLFAFLLIFSASPLTAESLKDLFVAATQSNQDYTIYKIDLELAKRQSSENPVYYVQYAYARICSILVDISSPVMPGMV